MFGTVNMIVSPVKHFGFNLVVEIAANFEPKPHTIFVHVCAPTHGTVLESLSYGSLAEIYVDVPE